MYAWQLMKALALQERRGWSRFVSMQPEVNLLYREEEREMIPLCIDQGVAVIPWSPLARGKLARPWDAKTHRSETDHFGKVLFAATAEQDRKVAEAVGDVARELGVPPAHVALAWLLQKGGITAPIIGVTKESHLADAVSALDLELGADEVARLEAPYVPHPVVGLSVPLPFRGRVSVVKKD
jgi:aryl-alcohol dehydrogenase-like predicted oxidoreductase